MKMFVVKFENVFLCCNNVNYMKCWYEKENNVRFCSNSNRLTNIFGNNRMKSDPGKLPILKVQEGKKCIN